jgi:hypothetical protein
MASFMKDNEFVRICNELNITNQFAEVQNVLYKTNDYLYSFFAASLVSNEDILAGLLNKLYEENAKEFISVICKLVAYQIPHSYYISSVSEIKRDLQLLGASASELQLINTAWEIEDRNYHKKARVLKELVISRATGGMVEEVHYQSIRKSLYNNSLLKDKVPDFIVDNASVYEFWQFIKYKYRSYSERKYFLQDAFEPLLNASLVLGDTSPHQDIIPEIADEINEQYISEAWRKALNRLKEDAEAAITSARSLVELVCKHILDEIGAKYDDAADLPKLYKLTAAQLNLSPDQHTEQLFKQILGGCQTVIEGLGALRNKLGDAHGKSKLKAKPSERHAALAVNLSGSMCSFLLQTYLHVKK